MDTQNTDGIITNWINLRKSNGDVEAWRFANDNSNGRNACAIKVGVAYYYFKKWEILGQPVAYIWTEVPQSEW